MKVGSNFNSEYISIYQQPPMHSKIPRLVVLKDLNLSQQKFEPNVYVRFPAQIQSIPNKPDTIYIKESKLEISVKNGIDGLQEGDYVVVLGLFVGEELLEGKVKKIEKETKLRMEKVYQMMEAEEETIIKGRQNKIGVFVPPIWKN